MAWDEGGLGEPLLDDEDDEEEALLVDGGCDELGCDDELLLEEALLDDGLGGGLLDGGVGMLGGCGIVGLLALGQPDRSKAQDSRTEAAARRDAGPAHAVGRPAPRPVCP